MGEETLKKIQRKTEALKKISTELGDEINRLAEVVAHNRKLLNDVKSDYETSERVLNTLNDMKRKSEKREMM